MKKTSIAGIGAIAVAMSSLITMTAAPLAQAAPVNGAAGYNSVDRTATDVTADALPTAQIDGVAWTTKIVGDIVYVGGDFKNSRPAGAAEGTQLTPRSNMLAFNLKTGELLPNFQMDADRPVKALALSPDKTRLYVGGMFSSFGGQTRYRLAAINTADGTLVSDFKPTLNATVETITVTNDTVYVGGVFGTANKQPRPGHLAAFDLKGNLLPWAPVANTPVKTIVATPDHSRIILGGVFATINGQVAPASASVDAKTGALMPWAFNKKSNLSSETQGVGLYNLYSDGKFIYASGFSFRSVGTLRGFEGVAKLDPMTGNIVWAADCHGDSYGTVAMGNRLFVASHAHNCAAQGTFPEGKDPNNGLQAFHRASAYTMEATSVTKKNLVNGYMDFEGTPAPAQVNWYPNLSAGTYTGQNQAAWALDATSEYLVMVGEFPRANGVKQQGLVRFATTPTAPSKVGPEDVPKNLIASTTVTSVNLKWTSSWDKDNQNLTYSVYRNDQAAPIGTVNASSVFWNQPTLSYLDSTVKTGVNYTYKVVVSDPNGNKKTSDPITVTPLAPAENYKKSVLASSPLLYWRLNETTGTGSVSLGTSKNNLVVRSHVTKGTAGNLAPNTSMTFIGDNLSQGYSAARAAMTTPAYTVEAWVKTTSKTGGVILSQGNLAYGNSAVYDRSLYMTTTGQFGMSITNGTARPNMITLTNKAYNDGKWHHVVAQNDPAYGLRIYVDGVSVRSTPGKFTPSTASMYWRVGGDTINKGYTGAPTNNYFIGSINDVVVYNTALNAATVAKHYNS